MPDQLEQERLDLLTRLVALEANHARLKTQPDNRDGHKHHHVELAAYQQDVRTYRAKMTAIRRERGLPDPTLDFFK